MTEQTFKMVTIISEGVLTETLIELVKSKGAKGFTITDVRGEGSVHRQSGEVPEFKAKIEILCSPGIATSIMTEISQVYFDDYSIITFSTDVSVLRPEKFSK